jgi:hypothetical protein
VRRTWGVRRSDEGEAQRRRWTFYEAINKKAETVLSFLGQLGRPF